MAIHANGTVNTGTYYKADAHGNGDGYHGGTSFKWPWTHSGTTYYEYQQAFAYYSNANWYSNYGETTWSSSPFDTHTNQPTATGTFTPMSGSLTGSTVLIDLSGISCTPGSGTWTSSKIYYQYSSDNTTWEAITELGTTSTTSYTWTVTSFAGGYYRLYITTYDGTQWSALLDTTNNTFVADHTETGYTGTLASNQTATTIDKTDYDTIQYLVTTSSLRLIKYTPPTWVSTNFSNESITQLQTEINQARSDYGLSQYTFSLTSVVDNFTKITATDMVDMRTAANAAYETAKGSEFEWTNTITATPNIYPIEDQDILDLRDLLDALGE